MRCRATSSPVHRSSTRWRPPSSSTPGARSTSGCSRPCVAGDAAGGDSRGRQSAALLVHAPGAGYDACGVLADLRVDDHPDATRELARVHALATLVFGGPEDVAPLQGALRDEVAAHLAAAGYPVDGDGGTLEHSLAAWMSAANLENRHSPTGIDARVLTQLRSVGRDLTEH